MFARFRDAAFADFHSLARGKDDVYDADISFLVPTLWECTAFDALRRGE